MTPVDMGEKASSQQEWQKADARVLGQILAAQNVVFALPDAAHFAEFYAQTLVSIPGVGGSVVCVGGSSVQAGDIARTECAACEAMRRLRDRDTVVPADSPLECPLAGKSGIRVIPIDSFHHHFGMFALCVEDSPTFGLYEPFLNNLSNYVGLILENRWQQRRVAERTAQLEAANNELEAFAYSVSHDLRAPLRHIDGFVGLLDKRVADALDEQSRRYMATISEAARHMGALIDDLLSFSRMGRRELAATSVGLEELVHDVIAGFEPDLRERAVEWQIAPLPPVTGDRAMLRVVLVNLVSNALKFTRPRHPARIEIGCRLDGRETVCFVRDNGVGFDARYADKLFGVFQRLHRADEFEGTGIGLATVRRIIQRHGGRTWAAGEVGQGATFWFSLPRATAARQP